MRDAKLATPYLSRSKFCGFPGDAAYPIAMANIGATAKNVSFRRKMDFISRA